MMLGVEMVYKFLGFGEVNGKDAEYIVYESQPNGGFVWYESSFSSSWPIKMLA